MRRRVRRRIDGGGAVDADDEDDLDLGDFDDLVSDADPETFDRTFRLTSDLVPFAGEEAPPIPRPWQGIPRAGILFNLNFVWDDDAEEWVRQKKTDEAAFAVPWIDLAIDQADPAVTVDSTGVTVDQTQPEVTVTVT